MKSIFVSSSFKDMQDERDIIQKVVVPEINEFAKAYGETVQLVDLRWGVDTSDMESEAGAKKVLKVCLDEIERTKPYIIALLGDRYGWIPSLKLIKEAADKKHFQIVNRNKSVTELEIEYGAMAYPDEKEHYLFYFREPLPYETMSKNNKEIFAPSTEEDRRMMERLKKDISSKFEDKIYTYNAKWNSEKGNIEDLSSLTNQMVHNIKEMLTKEWGETKKISWQEQTSIDINCFVEEKCSHFVGRENILLEYDKFIKDKEHNVLVIKGESGAGKSSLICQTIKRLSKNKNLTILPVICGNNNTSTTGENILNYLVYKLETLVGRGTHFGDEVEDAESQEKKSNKKLMVQNWRDELERLMEEYTSKFNKQLVIVVDALDQLLIDESVERLLFLPYILPNNVKVIMSCLQEYNLNYKLGILAKSTTIPVGSLDILEQRKAIVSILAHHSKKVDKSVMEAICNKPKSTNYLYMSLVLQRLIMLDKDDFKEITRIGDGIDAINKYLTIVIETLPDTLEELSGTIIYEAGVRINSEFVNHVMGLIAESRTGLREKDLQGIYEILGMPWSNLDFVLMKRYLSSYLMERADGRIDFTHKIIRSGLRKRNIEKEELGKEILRYLKSLGVEDSIKANEILYHSHKEKDYEHLFEYISDVYNKDDKRTIKSVCKEIRDITLNDGIEIIHEIYKRGGKENKWREVINFIIFYLDEQYTNGVKDRKIKEEIYNKLEPYIEKTYMKVKNDKVKRILGVLYMKIGEIYKENKNLKTAKEYFEKYLHISEEISKDSETLTSKIDLSVSNSRLADISKEQGKLEEAKQYYEKSILIYEGIDKKTATVQSRRNLGVAYIKLGSVNKEQGKLEEAKEYYEKSLIINEDLYKETGTLQSRRDLSINYEKIGDIDKEQGKLEEAKQYYEKSLIVDESIYKETGTVQSRRSLRLDYEKLGDIDETQGKLEEAKDYYEKALIVSKTLEKETEVLSDKRNVFYNNYMIGLCLKRENKAREALTYYLKAYKGAKFLVENQNTSLSKKDYKLVIDRLVGMYDELEEYDNKANILKELVEYRLNIVKEDKTEKTYNELAQIYFKLAHCYKKDSEDRNEYLQSSYKIWNDLYKQTKNEDYLDKCNFIKYKLKINI